MQTQGTIIGRRTAGARARRGLATITKRVPADGWPIVTVTNPFPARRMAIAAIQSLFRQAGWPLQPLQSRFRLTECRLQPLQDDSRWDRYLGMTAVMTQVPVPTANV